MAIPALMSKKLNGRPVMMRISREEETYIGRVRPGCQAGIKMGFRKDGTVHRDRRVHRRIGGPVSPPGRPPERGQHRVARRISPRRFASAASRWRPTRRRACRSARRAGLQSAVMFEPMIDKAARKLGIDEIEIRKINAPVTGSKFGLSEAPGRPRTTVTSAFVKEALDRGRELFNWDERRKRARPAAGHEGPRRRRRRSAPSPPDRSASMGSSSSSRTARSTSIRASATSARTRCSTPRASSPRSSACRGKAAKSRGATRAKAWPWSSSQAGSQTTHAHSRANHAAAMDGDRQAPGDRGARKGRQRRELQGRRRARVRARRLAHLRAGRRGGDQARRQVRRPRGAGEHQRDDQGLGRAGSPVRG